MKNLFSKTENFKSEYCCSVVKVGTLTPIENSDFLAKTIINGESVVVRKDEIHDGDILFYVSNECQINQEFLSINNLFNISSYELNKNADIVKSLLDKSKESNDSYYNEAKSKVGIFSKNCRVRVVKLRNVPSYGFLFRFESMVKFCPKLRDINIEDYLGEEFDAVDNELFVKAYIPSPKISTTEIRDKGKKIKRFDRLISNQFLLHYDTLPFGKNIDKISPNDNVTVTAKLHGTSFILGNVLTRQPLQLSVVKKLLNILVKALKIRKTNIFKDFIEDYDILYSSRTVIKNRYIDKHGKSVNSNDVWADYYNLLKDVIPQDTTIYGEIIGYKTNTSQLIQKGYDYGCMTGENKLMIYRVVVNKQELDVMDIKKWTEDLISKYPSLKRNIMVIPILYHGKLSELYPDIAINEDWNNNILQCLKGDKEHFGMELKESLCKNKVAREGIVIRKDNDPITEAFKLKTDAFLKKEAELIDNGEIDAEMIETNY